MGLDDSGVDLGGASLVSNGGIRADGVGGTGLASCASKDGTSDELDERVTSLVG